MHELSIAQALVEQLDDLARREGAQRVVRVTLQVGALSGVDPDALADAFPLAAEGTPAAGAQIAVEAVPAGLTCLDCGKSWTQTHLALLCEACGSFHVDLTAGRELLIRAVEIET